MESNTPEAAFKSVLKTLKANKVMVDTRTDGIYIRLAGNNQKGEAFSHQFVNALPFMDAGRTNTYKHAERELSILSKSNTDPHNRPIIEPFSKEILALCEAFGKSGQSGSAPYVATALAHAIKKLLLQEPISPITGIDEEWVHIGDASENDEMMYQNSRCSALFKGKSGRSWYLDAIIKKTQKNICYSGSFWLSREDYLTGDTSKKIGSKHYVKSFPFTPKTFYIDVIEEEVAPDSWVMYLKDPKQLEKVWKYYDQRLH